MNEIDPAIATLDGKAALPRKNGELVFQAPREGRAFGLAVALNEKRAYPWNEFRVQLVTEIAGGNPDYYENWLGALETVLINRRIVTEDGIRRRASEYRALKRDPVF